VFSWCSGAFPQYSALPIDAVVDPVVGVVLVMA
jgi:hypothetical protein